MRALILALVLLFVGCGGGCGSPQRVSGTRNIQYTPELVKGSVFRMEIDQFGLAMGSGTVWKVQDGYGITAGHVCLNDGPGVEFFARLQDNSRVPLHVVKTNDPAKGEPDLCVVTGDLPGAALDKLGTPPAYGDQVWYTGAPHAVYFGGLEPSFLGMALNPGYMSIAWGQGASGSPVYTRDGIIGVLVSGFNGTAISGYVPVAKLDEFLRSL